MSAVENMSANVGNVGSAPAGKPATAQQGAITLRGSTDLVAEFFELAVYMVLCVQRGGF